MKVHDMDKEINSSTVVSELQKCLKIIESGEDTGKLSEILVRLLGVGICDLHCLAGSGRFFQSILDMVPVPIYYKDIYGVYIGCNESLAVLYKKTKKEIIGKTVSDIFTEEEARLFSYSDTVLLKEKSHEMVEHKGRFSPMGGKLFKIHKKLVENSSGLPAGILGVVQDISEHKQNEERAWQGEAFYKSLYEQSPMPSIIFDSMGMVENMNYAALKIFGSEAQLIASDILSVFCKCSDFEKVMNSAGVPVRVLVQSEKGEINAVASVTESSVSDTVKYKISFIDEESII